MEHAINHFLRLKTYLKWLFHMLKQNLNNAKEKFFN